MSKSPNINLELTPAAEGDKNFQTWRTELAGEDSSSNMMILDTEIGQIKAGYLPTSQKGTPGGVASLDAAGKVPSGQLPAMDYDPAGSAAAVQAELDTHEADKSNPHSVTKTQVGLGNVDNTSDANKPVSTAVQTALDAKADKAVPGAANNVALLDASGNLADSGKSIDSLGGIPIVTTSGTGAAYTATVPGITELYDGAIFIMKLHTNSTSMSPTLDVNGLGAKGLMRRVTGMSDYPTSFVSGTYNDWLKKSRAYLVMFTNTFWVIESMPKTPAADLHGTTPVASGGTGVTSVGGTDYTTTRFRGSQLCSADTNPTINGTINWTYA